MNKILSLLNFKIYEKLLDNVTMLALICKSTIFDFKFYQGRKVNKWSLIEIEKYFSGSKKNL